MKKSQHSMLFFPGLLVVLLGIGFVFASSRTPTSSYQPSPSPSDAALLLVLPTPLASSTPHISPSPFTSPKPSPKPAVPLTCETLNGQMVLGAGGKGYIGCDMVVNSGQIDLQRSYCEGQTTHQKEYLVPDAYGRRDRYWTTLNNLDPNEVVKVFAYSKSGTKVPCLPDLNR